jgi:hypothetical protein
MGRVPSVAQMPALPALGQLPQINPPGPGYKPITNRHKPENEWCGWNWGYWGTPKKISAKDVASGLCPDKLAGKSCISGHRPGTASFVIGLLQRSLKAFGHSLWVSVALYSALDVPLQRDVASSPPEPA